MLGSFVSFSEGESYLGTSNWAHINKFGKFMITHCVLKAAGPGGGVIVIPDGKQ